MELLNFVGRLFMDQFVQMITSLLHEYVSQISQTAVIIAEVVLEHSSNNFQMPFYGLKGKCEPPSSI